MKTKKQNSESASRKPATASKGIFKVLSVRTLSKFSRKSHMSASFLEEAGFKTSPTPSSARSLRSGVSAVPGDKGSIYIECELKADAPAGLFRMVRIDRGTPHNIDSGHIQLALPLPGGGFDIQAAGDDELADWSIEACPADIPEIPVRGSSVPDEMPDDETRPLPDKRSVSEDLESGRDTSSGPKPTKPAGTEEDCATIQGVDPEKIKRFLVAPSRPAEPTKTNPLSFLGWKEDDRMRRFVAEHCNGAKSLKAVSAELDKLKAGKPEGESFKEFAARLGLKPNEIHTLSMVSKLHDDLCPLLDKPHDDPERLTYNDLRIMSYFSKERQLDAWNAAKGKGTRRQITEELRRLLMDSLSKDWMPP
ncbi:MAG: hypothetical protein KGI49_02245 [Patescibacteria group bacterium]|nr:hypothetical protein [Patescibacteria group bacterium]